MSPPIQVLVVDDNPVATANLIAFLQDEGMMATGAASGAEALAALAAYPFDVGIFDLRLPDTDGNTLVLAAHRLHPELGILLHTGTVDYTPPPELLAIGVVDRHIFRKPVHDMTAIVEAIRAHVPPSP